MTTVITNNELQNYIVSAIEDIAKKDVDKLFEEAINDFRIKCEEKRAETMVKVIARIFEQMDTMSQEIIIKIPFNRNN